MADSSGHRRRGAPKPGVARPPHGAPAVSVTEATRRDGPQVLSVTEVTRRIKGAIADAVGSVAVRGEVTELKRASSGHLYFSLYDGRAKLPAVMWRSTAQRSRVPLTRGSSVVAYGRVDVYEPHGRYQMIVDRVTDDGEGALLAELEQLRRRLHAEGLFDPTRKRPLPLLPRTIGVVTAPTGAAVRDILVTIGRRAPARVVVAPCLVQGAQAPGSIVAALARLARFRDEAGRPVDVAIVGRGGGSLHDLWAFNDEAVVRAVAAAPWPTVSGVGHEVDRVLTDEVADARAATPTAAAEVATPVAADLAAQVRWAAQRAQDAMWSRLEGHLDRLEEARVGLVGTRERLHAAQARVDAARDRAARAMERRLQAARGRRDVARAKLRNLHPAERVRSGRQAVGALRARLERAGRALPADRRAQVTSLVRRLQALGPQQTLARGYAIARRSDGAVVRAPADAPIGAMVGLLLAEGALRVRVEGAEPRHRFGPGGAGGPGEPPTPGGDVDPA